MKENFKQKKLDICTINIHGDIRVLWIYSEWRSNTDWDMSVSAYEKNNELLDWIGRHKSVTVEVKKQNNICRITAIERKMHILHNT